MIEMCCEYLSVRCIWQYVIIMPRTSFRVDPHSIVCLNVKELLARSRCHIWSLSDSKVIRTHNHLVRKRTLNYLAKLAKWLWVQVTLLSLNLNFLIKPFCYMSSKSRRKLKISSEQKELPRLNKRVFYQF